MRGRSIDGLVNKRAAKHLREFKHEVLDRFGDRVKSMRLFGSRARGDAKPNSDYDVIVFIDEHENRRAVNHALSDLAYRHIVAGIAIQPVSVPLDFLAKSKELPLALGVSQEGIELL